MILRNSETRFHGVINAFFASKEDEGGVVAKAVPAEKKEMFRFELDQEDGKKLNVLALMKGFSVSEWVCATVGREVRREYSEWVKSQAQEN